MTDHNPVDIAHEVLGRDMHGVTSPLIALMHAESCALARAVLDLTDKVERMKALAANLDVAALYAINHPDADDDLKAHAHADRGLAAQILAILNGEPR